jgi:2'-5' RNA ligase
MRLFISLNFKKEVIDQIKNVIHEVQLNSVQGKYVSDEHIHLTVEFLGEIQDNQLNLIKAIMDELEFGPFILNLTKIGYFKRREGNIYWLGVEDHDTLFNIHKKLHQRLLDQGFELEDREYKPHITIGRKVKLKDHFNPDELDDIVENIKIDINKVDLMKSEFIHGRLIHSIIYSR